MSGEARRPWVLASGAPGGPPCSATATVPVLMSGLLKHRRSEISPDHLLGHSDLRPGGSGQDTGAVLPASRVPGPGGLKWAPTLGAGATSGRYHKYQTRVAWQLLPGHSSLPGHRLGLLCINQWDR